MNTLTTRRAGTRTKMAIGAIAGCLLSALSVQAVNAATLDEVPSFVVKYDEQSLATESGARALYKHLVTASRQVCPEDTGRNLRLAAFIRRCQEESVARAVRQINNPRLAAVYASSTRSG